MHRVVYNRIDDVNVNVNHCNGPQRDWEIGCWLRVIDYDKSHLMTRFIA